MASMNIALAFATLLLYFSGSSADGPTYILWNAETEPPEERREIWSTYFGTDDVINLAQEGTKLSIEYAWWSDASGGSVLFTLFGPQGLEFSHCENTSPPFLLGNNGYRSIDPWTPALGSYFLVLMFYRQPKCKGEMLSAYEHHHKEHIAAFAVVDEPDAVGTCPCWDYDTYLEAWASRGPQCTTDEDGKYFALMCESDYTVDRKFLVNKENKKFVCDVRDLDDGEDEENKKIITKDQYNVCKAQLKLFE